MTTRQRIKELENVITSCEGTRHRRREQLEAIAERDTLALQLQQQQQQQGVEERETKQCVAKEIGNQEIADVCGICGGVMRRLAQESLLACEECGNAEPYVEWGNWNAHGHEKVPDQFSYKRANHFIEWLNAAQGREQTTIPEKVLQACGQEIKRLRVPHHKVTPPVIRQALKANKQGKYYEHSVLICFKLTGRRPPRFTASQEEALKTMFLSIQEPFERVRQVKAPERRNFLSYAYCLFKFCELLGLDSFLSSFTLLKGRDKLYKQDVIFEGICKELDWQFIPST